MSYNIGAKLLYYIVSNTIVEIVHCPQQFYGYFYFMTTFKKYLVKTIQTLLYFRIV
jgi:hypothetical protein